MNLFKKYNVADLSEASILSSEMVDKIDLWNNILQGKAFWNLENHSCGIVGTTIGAITKPVAEELDISAPKNEELDSVMKRLNENSHELVQNIIAVGGSVVRPIYTNNKMQYEIIRLGNYLPTSYDLDGTLTGCTITKKIQGNKQEFLLLEKHKYENKTHSVELELYKIKGDSLSKCSLTDCSSTAELTPAYSWNNVEKPFIVEIKNRLPNIVDGSPVPCALWQNTEGLIQDADEQYNRMLWEQEAGALRIFADEDMFRKKQRLFAGKDIEVDRIPPKLNKLIVQLSGTGLNEEKIKDFAPTLRTEQQKEAFNQILRRSELAWNIGKGTLSDLEAVVQTATQYTGGKKVLYSMVDSIESELEEKYKHLAYVFAYMISAYEESVPFNDEIEVTYNDSARKDPEALKNMALMELQNKVLQPYEYRMQFYGEDEETAKANVPEVTSSNDFGGRFSFE